MWPFRKRREPTFEIRLRLALRQHFREVREMHGRSCVQFGLFCPEYIEAVKFDSNPNAPLHVPVYTEFDIRKV